MGLISDTPQRGTDEELRALIARAQADDPTLLEHGDAFDLIEDLATEVLERRARHDSGPEVSEALALLAPHTFGCVHLSEHVEAVLAKLKRLEAVAR